MAWLFFAVGISTTTWDDMGGLHAPCVQSWGEAFCSEVSACNVAKQCKKSGQQPTKIKRSVKTHLEIKINRTQCITRQESHPNIHGGSSFGPSRRWPFDRTGWLSRAMPRKVDGHKMAKGSYWMLLMNNKYVTIQYRSRSSHKSI